MQLTHRNLWLNATVFGLHTTVTDKDVLLHTLPMFHANGWGMPFGITGVGGKHIVLRQVDGAEILRRIDRHGVTLMCAAPAVVNAALDAAAEWDGPIPGNGTVRIVVAGAPPPTRTIERVIDIAAKQFGYDRIDLRRRNLIPPKAQPYANPLGMTYDCGDYGKIMDRALALSDWKTFSKRKRESKRAGKLRGNSPLRMRST